MLLQLFAPEIHGGHAPAHHCSVPGCKQARTKVGEHGGGNRRLQQQAAAPAAAAAAAAARRTVIEVHWWWPV
jgi:hypothetical protein